jgi:hypothetical protein
MVYVLGRLTNILADREEGGRRDSYQEVFAVTGRLLLVYSFLGVRGEIDEVVGVALDLEIKPPGFVHARLPEVLGLVVLLGVQGWMLKVFD